METCVPEDCVIVSTASLFCDKLYTRPEAEFAQLGDVLQAAWKSVMESSLPIGSRNSNLLNDIQGHSPTVNLSMDGWLNMELAAAF